MKSSKMFAVLALVFFGILTLMGEVFSFLSFLPKVQFWFLGYFGYIWAFGLAFVCYEKNLKFDNVLLEKILGGVIIVFALLVLQGLFFSNAGILGVAFNNVLKPIITSLGVFILGLLMLGFGVMLYTEKSPKELYKTILNALKEDLKKDLKQAKASKDVLHKNTEKLKVFWQKTKAFFTPPAKKDSIKPDIVELKSDPIEVKEEPLEVTEESSQEIPQSTKQQEELRPLTLEELIEQSKDNPPPKERVSFQFKEEEEELPQENVEPLESKSFEEGIDVLRQDIELPMREDNPLEETPKETKEDSMIRVISAKSIQQDSFDPMQFQMQSMASLENFKRFEKSELYSKEEEQKEESIKLIKKESTAQGEPESFIEEPIEQSSKEFSKKAIKSYPKNLYATTPFSAYYDKDSVGTHDRLVDLESFSKEYPSSKNTLPKTIFYYGNTASVHPPKNMESKITLSQENIEVAENIEPKVVLSQDQASVEENIEISVESNILQDSIVAPQTQDQTLNQEQNQIPEPMPQLKYTTIPNAIPTFDYGYTHYKEPAQPIQNQLAIHTESKLNMESKISQQQILPQQPNKQQDQTVPKTQNHPQALSTQEPTPPQILLSSQTKSTPEPLPQQAPPPSVQIPQESRETSRSVEIVKTLEENVALLKDLEMTQTPQVLESKDYQLPKVEFLQEPKSAHIEVDEAEIDRKINDLLNKMRVFKIEGDIARTYSGPIVTTFEFRPNPNVKVSRILTLQDDLAMALRAKTIRIQAPIPGKDVVGIEIPNAQVETIYLREILENDLFKNSASPLTLALGKDIVGNPFVTDLKKLPHLLIAGTTGSGKSVGINAMILSLLYKNPPDKLKLIMVDPKMVEFSIYNDIPHLLTPVITNPRNAIFALDVAVKEMEQRNALISEARVKNIESYNQKAEIEGFDPFPYIVIIIDELADLMMTGGKEAEASISRLTQMARSSGIHLIVATQRPSVDVVTGLIKANLPSRISYKVGQKIDSKVILDCHGAESLLGNGDMLFAMGGGNVMRLHAPFSTEEEIERIVEFIKAQCPPQYDERFLQKEERSQVQSNGEADDLYEEAKRIMLTEGKTSISHIQRRLGIGFNKAANIVEQMQQRGFLSKENSRGLREIIGE